MEYYTKGLYVRFMATKAQVKASNKYDKENTKNINLRLNKKTDKDILDFLETVQPSKMGYIKNLIRKDIKSKNE